MRRRRHYRWQGPQPGRCEERIANAPDDLFDLSPVSGVPAETTRENWAAVLPSDVPFIWERGRYGCQGQDRELVD